MFFNGAQKTSAGASRTDDTKRLFGLNSLRCGTVMFRLSIFVKVSSRNSWRIPKENFCTLKLLKCCKGDEARGTFDTKGDIEREENGQAPGKTTITRLRFVSGNNPVTLRLHLMNKVQNKNENAGYQTRFGFFRNGLSWLLGDAAK